MQQTLFDSMVYTFGSKETIALKPDAFWLLKRGVVKTFTWNKEGTVVALGYWGPEDVIGQPLSSVDPYQILCLTRVEALYIPQTQWSWLSKSICRSIQQTEKLLCIIRSERMYQRLLGILSWLAQKFGRPVRQGRLIDLRLTHQELAELAGTTRVTVSRLLGQFEQDGIISRPRRHAILLHNWTPFERF